MRFTRKIILTVILILFLGSVGIALSFRSGIFDVDSVQIEMIGDSAYARTSSVNIPGPAGLYSRIKKQTFALEKKKIWEVDLRKLEAALVSDEWIKEIWISRAFPNQIKLRVVPKESVFALLNSASGGSQFVPVLQDGTMLSALPLNAVPNVPVARGEIFQKDLSRRIKIAALLSSLPEDGSVGRKNISEILWNNDEGYQIILNHPRIEVSLGEEQLQIKVQRVAHVLDYLETNQLKGRVIDASFSKKVLVRLRKDP